MLVKFNNIVTFKQYIFSKCFLIDSILQNNSKVCVLVFSICTGVANFKATNLNIGI